MKNLCIIVEGRTECLFIKEVIAPHLYAFDWIVTPITLPTGKNNIGVHKGGWRQVGGYQYAIEQIVKIIKTRKDAELFTTFFDLYGFPSDIPCFSKLSALTTPYEKVNLIEEQLKNDLDNRFSEDPSYNIHKFIPYIQPYEFEAFLFIDPDCSATELSNGDNFAVTSLKSDIAKVIATFDSPEHINSSPSTAPSKRIAALVPNFKKNKAGKAGFSWRIAEKVGIFGIRDSCHHFNEWLTQIESQ